MAKRKSPGKNTPSSFNRNPFKDLKGFAASSPEKEPEPALKDEEASAAQEKERSFFEEMAFLGVAPLDDTAAESTVCDERQPEQSNSSQESDTQSEEELFLDALGTLDVRFSDQLPEETVQAQPRRLKQLKKGQLSPDASLDLHGLLRHQVAEKLGHFLQNAVYQQWGTLLIVTGRGLHSADGQPVLRHEVEKFLAGEGQAHVAEWCRAPRQYGGEGALVVFLKKVHPETE